MSEMQGVPPVVIVYGDSGRGKTTDALWSFPGALYIPIHKDALRPSETTCGYALKPDQVQPQRRLTQATGLLMQIANAQKKEGRLFYPEIVVDDLSLLMSAELRAMEESGRYPKKGDGAFRKWSDLGALLQEFCDVARHEVGAAVIINAHPRAAETDRTTGMYYMGGPSLPSRKLTVYIPFIATSVYQVGMDSSRLMWPGVYRSNPDGAWLRKCRLGYNGELPMNLGELFRGAGISVSRHPGLPWQEEYVQAIAEHVLSGASPRDAGKRAIEQLAGQPSAVVGWTIRDGLDRAAIRQIRSVGVLSAFQ